MESENVVAEDLCHTQSITRHRGRDGMDLLAEPVHNDADPIVTLGFW